MPPAREPGHPLAAGPRCELTTASARPASAQVTSGGGRSPGDSGLRPPGVARWSRSWTEPSSSGCGSGSRTAGHAGWAARRSATAAACARGVGDRDRRNRDAVGDVPDYREVVRDEQVGHSRPAGRSLIPERSADDSADGGPRVEGRVGAWKIIWISRCSRLPSVRRAWSRSAPSKVTWPDVAGRNRPASARWWTSRSRSRRRGRESRRGAS